MELTPALRLGWLNGWILLGLLYLIYGILLLAFPKKVRGRLYEYDRSSWSRSQRAFSLMRRLLVVVCLVLMIFTSLKIGSYVFIAGIMLYALGLAGFVSALFNFKNTPLDQPVTNGLYSVSRHPQALMLFISGVGMCLAIGSWFALFIQIMAALFGRSRILTEETACLERYGESYRDYMKRVPRYLLIKTSMKQEGEDVSSV